VAEHTKEPWDYSQFAGATPDDPPDPAYICELNNDDYPDGVIAWAHQDRPTEQQDADVRRIAACVNACAGIPTEAIEAAVVSAAFECLQDLVAICEHDGISGKAIDRAKAALATVTPKGG
jgi:hypothetical protein